MTDKTKEEKIIHLKRELERAERAYDKAMRIGSRTWKSPYNISSTHALALITHLTNKLKSLGADIK